jgi:hypothetical protein
MSITQIEGGSMAKTQVQSWGIGDMFLVKNLDGSECIGQIVGQERDVLNSVSCAFFDRRINRKSDLEEIQTLPPELVFAVLFVTRDLLDSGVWRVVGRFPVTLPREYFPYERLRANAYVGAKVVGSKNVNEFLNAFYGLRPWDDWKDPAYLDKLLISSAKKPSHVKYKADF